MRIIFITALLTAALGAFLACGNTGPGNSTSSTTGSASGSPTEAYKGLYAAVKAKDTERIKSHMSKSTLSFAEMVAGRQNTPIEKVFENGFTATTFSETLPEIRDERVKDQWGAVEVYNSKDKRWEDLGFVLEDGAWKLAIGDMFAGTFQSPGKGRSIKEQEAANAVSNNMIPMQTNANNSNVKVIVPKEAPKADTK